MLIGHSLSMQRKNIVKDGLVLWLDGEDFMNSPPTSLLRDRSGNGTNATPSGMAYTSSSGSDNNGGIASDGVDDRLLITNGSKIFDTNAYTFETKLSILQLPSAWRCILDSRQGTTQAFALYISDTNRLSFTTQATSDLVSTFACQANTEYHIVCKFEGATKSLYINGVLNGTASKTMTTVDATLISIFANYLNSEFTKIKSKFFRIYNRALTDAEILQNYNTSK